MNRKHWLALWLFLVCTMIIAMVVIGGITRLTHSGLSMVEWNPILGAIPPLNDREWQTVFEKYRNFPEYRLLNHGMTLSEFKYIFFWEYFHRLVARMIGVVLFLPWAVFWLRGWINRQLAVRLCIGAFLGGLQGVMGWLMVKSGLVDQPHVSHYRLAAHLLLAFGVLAYFFWATLDLLDESKSRAPLSRAQVRGVRFITALVILQVFYGALTAGLRAGFGYNTFPKMADEWVPTGILRMQPWFANAFENTITVQFLHRGLGWALLLTISAAWFYALRLKLSTAQQRGMHFLMATILIQFGLGVATLLWVVPIGLGTLHQLGACFLFLSAVYLNHAISRAA